MLPKQPYEDALFDLPFDLPAGVTLVSIDDILATPKGLVAEVTGLAVVGNGVSGVLAQLQISGGTDGELYAIRVRCTDTAGQKVEADGEIMVLDLNWTVPDGEAGAYLSPREYVERFGVAETVRLTDERGLGVIEKAPIQAALRDARATVDSYLARRYTLPLSTIPDIVVKITADLARYQLHGLQMSDTVAERKKDAVRDLERISAGSMVLPADEVTETGSLAPEISGPGRTFSKDTLEGF